MRLENQIFDTGGTLWDFRALTAQKNDTRKLHAAQCTGIDVIHRGRVKFFLNHTRVIPEPSKERKPEP